MRFHSINVFWVYLGPEVAGDVGVWYGDAVDQPSHLMAPTDVQLVVHDIRTGDVVGDHREAIGPRRAGCLLNLQPVDEGSRRDGFRLCGIRGDNHGLVLCRETQLKMQNRCRPGEHRDGLLVRHEVRVNNRDSIFAKGNRIKMKLPCVVRGGCQSEFRGFRFQNYLDAGNRAMLWIVNNAARALCQRPSQGQRHQAPKQEVRLIKLCA